MLAYIISIVLGLSSFTLFGMAFFSPDVHRKDDFLWSGVGLFYALVLWICAGRITGALLLGQTASAILIISFGWQTLQLRRAGTGVQNLDFSLLNWLESRFGPVASLPSTTVRTVQTKIPETVVTPEPEPREEMAVPTEKLEAKINPNQPNPQVKNWFGLGRNQAEVIPLNAAPREEFEEFDIEQSDEDVTETSQISEFPAPEVSEVGKVIVGIYDLEETPPTQPFISPDSVSAPDEPDQNS